MSFHKCKIKKASEFETALSKQAVISLHRGMRAVTGRSKPRQSRLEYYKSVATCQRSLGNKSDSMSKPVSVGHQIRGFKCEPSRWPALLVRGSTFGEIRTSVQSQLILVTTDYNQTENYWNPLKFKLLDLVFFKFIRNKKNKKENLKILIYIRLYYKRNWRP